jgi:L-iditol 2-dehydrogenase
MIAAHLIKTGLIEFREIPVPDPSEGEVVVKIRAALTCGTDLKAFQRGHPMIPMPGLFGHEFSGIVTQIGKSVRKFKIGDEVMAVHSAPCLKCRYCEKKEFNLCEKIMKTKVLGAFAEYILLPSHIVKQNLLHKPSLLSFEEAAFLEPLACVVSGMRGLEIKKGDKALIIGTGPIGILHLSILKMKGCHVTVTARKKSRLDFAKKMGADEVVEISGIERAIKKITGGMGFDFVFECTGQLEVWENSVNHTRKGGTVILFGGVKSGTSACFDTHRLHYDAITLRGVFHFTPQDVRTAYKLLSEKINVLPLISGHYPLKELSTAFEKLSKGEGIKYAIIP